MPRPFSRLPEPWAFVRHFTPNWFAMTMGTGVLALVIAHLPWALPGQMILAEVLWLFGVALFALFALFTLCCDEPLHRLGVRKVRADHQHRLHTRAVNQ